MEKKTALYEMHEKCGGKIVPFAGYLLPVQYPKGIIHEHKQVREHVGMFDVSHMGEFTLKGKDALANLNNLLTNNYNSLKDGFARYGIMCYPDGTTVDDLLVYKKKDEDYLIVVNASNCEKDYQWMKEHLLGEAEFRNISDEVSQIALQGPEAVGIISQFTDDIPARNYSFRENVDIGGINVLLSRTGYTGEDGFELYCRNEDVCTLWQLLLDKGVEPCGLGARDTLRLEAGMPLYGHELSDAIKPNESNLSFFIKFDKEFIGRSELEKAPERKRIGLIVTDKGIAREHCPVFADGKEVGFVSSGTFSPTLNKAVAMAIVSTEAAEGNEFEIEVRGRHLKAEKTALPFYKRNK